MYVQYKVNVSENQVDLVLLLTPVHIDFFLYICIFNRFDKAQADGRRVQIRMSARKVTNNVSCTGGFFAAFAPLIARVLPTIMSGLATGQRSGSVHKAVSGSDVAAIEYRN